MTILNLSYKWPSILYAKKNTTLANEETKTSERIAVNDKKNSGYMVPYFRHLGNSDELIAPLDIVEQIW